MNLSEIATRGTPTPDDVFFAVGMVLDTAAIADIIAGAQVTEREFFAAMNGISAMLKIAGNILQEGADIYCKEPAEASE